MTVPGKARWCALASVVALVAAGCGSDDNSSDTSSGTSTSSSQSASTNCSASIGIEAPITGQVAQLGGEQLHFAQLALSQFNAKNGTDIKLVQGDTQLTPAQATTVTQQFISNDKIVAIVGPAGSQEVSAVGPLITRAKLAAISGSATATDLTTSGKYPTFFRVVPRDDVQGPTDGNYIANKLKPKRVMIVDDQTSYSTGLADAIEPVLEKAGIQVDHQSVNQKQTDFSSLVSKVSGDTGVVFLPWQVASNAQQFGQNLAEQNKKAVIFGSDGLYNPDQFKIPGSYVSSFAPDINAIPSSKDLAQQAKAKYGAFGTFGPPLYAATLVAAEAIQRVCKAGDEPSRENVLAQIKKTNQSNSILGQPIKFTEQGDLIGAKFFVFKVGSGGKYKLVTTSS